jgi:starvation-inducible DNA-binding protein
MILNRTSIEGHDAEITIGLLRDTLVELIDLSLQAKQAHWNVVGPRFRGVHHQLDELVERTRGYADTVAERIATLGEPAQGLASHVEHQSKLDPFPAVFVKDDEVVKLVVDRLAGLSGRLRERIALARDRDPVTEDLLITALGSLEEQMWMFHAQLQ